MPGGPLADLQALLHREVPLSRHMGVAAARIEGGRRAGIEVPVELGSSREGEWIEAALFQGSYATI